MFGGLDPGKMAEMQKVTKNIDGTIITDYKDLTVTIKFQASTEEAKKALSSIMDAFSQALAQQLGMFFCIKGRRIERNKQ